MKICYFGNFFVTGDRANQNQIFRMCSAFCENDHEVTLVADFGAKTDSQLRRLFGVARIPLLWDVKIPNIIGASIFLAIGTLLRALVSKADILMTRDVRSAALINAFGFKVIYECHAMPNNLLSKISFWWLRHSPWKVFFVVISSALEREIRTKHKVIVAHDAASLSDINQELKSWPAGDITVGYSGSGYKGKGADFIPGLASMCPEFKFTVIGVGREEMLEKVDTIPENLVCISRIRPSEVAARIREFDILLAPYSRQVESAGGQEIGQWMSPLKTFEYMAAAKPIIASDLPVLREVLMHDKNSLLCEPGNLSGWSQALRDLAADPSRAIRLANNARAEVLAKYSWTARAERVLDEAVDYLL